MDFLGLTNRAIQAAACKVIKASQDVAISLQDLPDGDELRHQLRRIAEEVGERLRRHGARAKTIALKLRYSNFNTITRQTTREEPTDDTDEIHGEAAVLLDNVVRSGDKFRLVGVSCSNLEEERKEGGFLMKERRSGSFNRSLRLPDTVDTEKAKTVYENGVLIVTLPKAESKKAKRLKVAVGKSLAGKAD